MPERRDMPVRRRLWLAVAGAVGATVWVAQQPLDKRIFRSEYDDVELLGRAATDDRWHAAGWAAHVANGAVFGLAYSEVVRRTPRLSPMASAQLMAQAENFGLYPLAAIVDRHHPARGSIAKAFGGRQLAQATWRHALLGLVLGVVARRTCSPDR